MYLLGICCICIGTFIGMSIGMIIMSIGMSIGMIIMSIR